MAKGCIQGPTLLETARASQKQKEGASLCLGKGQLEMVLYDLASQKLQLERRGATRDLT